MYAFIEPRCNLNSISSTELLKLEMPEQFEKETWVMDASEKLQSIPNLREEGNKAYTNGNLDLASEKYSRALGFLEDLMLQYVHQLFYIIRNKQNSLKESSI